MKARAQKSHGNQSGCSLTKEVRY
eukprot:COSAG06_NODE_63309_length_262_cov_1.552147_1_plen_23_part_01